MKQFVKFNHNPSITVGKDISVYDTVETLPKVNCIRLWNEDVTTVVDDESHWVSVPQRI